MSCALSEALRLNCFGWHSSNSHSEPEPKHHRNSCWFGGIAAKLRERINRHGPSVHDRCLHPASQPLLLTLMFSEPKAATRAANDILWRQWTWLYLGSCAFTLALQLGYVVGLTTEIHGISWLAFVMAMASQAAFLNLIPALLTAWPWLRWRHRTWARIIAGALFALLQVAL